MENEKLEPWQQYLKDNEEKSDSKIKTKTDPKDGTVYEWNEKNHGWFPKVNDDFIALYRASYGFTEDLKPTEPPPSQPKGQLESHPKCRKAKKEKNNEVKKEPEWFEVDEKNDVHVYVSGMPSDITEEEYIDMMVKFGIIMEDPETRKLKIKLYKDDNGNYKGDGLCSYLKPESVELAIDILDESDMRGNKIKVEHAHFELKGEFNPNLKVKKRKKFKVNTQEKLLDWAERDAYKKRAHHRACVIHYLFDPSEFLNDPAAILDYKKELGDECKKFGDIKKVFIFDRNKDGVASVLFKDEESAQKCIKAMDGRLCGGKHLIAHIWDGVTKYEEEETEEEKANRIRLWHQSLEKEDEE